MGPTKINVHITGQPYLACVSVGSLGDHQGFDHGVIGQNNLGHWLPQN
jgi:hypothetical protein